MNKCETCGSENEELFEIVSKGVSYKFDTFECAISSLATACENCGCLITGRKLDQNGQSFCCQGCVEQSSADLTKTPQLATS